MLRRIAVLSAFLACLLIPDPADATYAGRNGLIAYDQGFEVACKVAAVRGADCTGGTESSGTRVVDVDGSRARRLRSFGDAVFAPGGRYLATTDGCTVYVSTIGGLPHRVSGRRECDSLPRWSPDARRLVFSDGEGPAPLVKTIRRDGTGERVIGPGMNPVWSPSGRKIAFTQCSYSEDEIPLACGIEEARADGAAARQLVSTGTESDGVVATWAPHGRRLALATGGRIEVVDLHGRVRVLGPGSDPSWSPNGDWIAFVRHDTLLEVMRPNGSGTKAITRFDAGFTWSPDSRFIAYVAEGDTVWLSVIRVSNRGRHTIATLASAPSRDDNYMCCPDWQTLPRLKGERLIAASLH